jgi:cation-transporting ATPase 13A1
MLFCDSARDRKKLVDVKETEKETTLCLAAAHALVRLDDGTVVGDPMEKTTLEALDWKLSKGAFVSFYTTSKLKFFA